ncbi:C2CD3 protein, partial [Polyodon spathula]|nr:C2CD3 protein [Polyodon spathula]
SDVSPSTGLPPLVEGQLRCFLRVTVSKILWTIQRPPAAPRVRLKWWGELSDGTCFRPRDSCQKEQKGVKTTARFAIRCGPKQFTSYLADMGMLVLDVVTKPDHLPIGRVQISGISQLSPTHSISGFFTLVSPTSEKLGELQVSLALEPLSETYDSSSSIPTTDMSIDTAMSALSKGASRDNQLVVPTQPLRLSINSTSGRDSVGSSASNTPRGKDHLYFQENNRVPKDTSSKTHVLPANSQASKDLISVLLDRGSKLRNAMVVSALQSDLDAEPAWKDIHLPLPLPNDTIRKPVSLPCMPSSGKLLENLLEPDPNLKPTQVKLLPLSEYQDQEYTLDTENRAIQLLLGSVNSSPLQHWDGTGSPPESLSGGSSINEESELNDPHYDQSLLENLFYKAPVSVQIIFMLLHQSWNFEALLTFYVQGAALTAGKEPHNAEQSRSIDLSVDRLTLLGRIHLARVIIETLKIPPDSTQTTPSKKAGKGKPPRPVSTRKCTYFVEYHFPVASSREEAGQVSMKTEVVRVASSKIIGGVVKFQQRFVFPLHFSGVMIEQWWNMDLEFKIYARKSTQKKPVPIGTAHFPLRKIIRSELLSLSTELSVFRLDGEKQELGPLKVSFELAADNKDFSTARAQCAGVSKTPSYAVTSPGHKTVSLPDNESSQQSDTDDASAFLPVKAHSEVRNMKPQTMKELKGENGIQLNPPYSAAVHNLNRQFSALRAEEEDGVLLHVLLMVPEGKDFSTGTVQPCNLYLNCKLFGTDEATRSSVIWGQNQPAFNFAQVAPVTMTSGLLERMKNNVMVIEVWKKVPSPGQDKLVGLAKLPLHQFYMSFRDPKISHLLLQAQYPVVGVDSYMPVIDVFTGSIQGRLRVLLAMGSGEQILSLQRLKSEEGTSAPSVQRPTHFLDQMPSTPSEVFFLRLGNSMREHIFEIKVERVKGLTPLQSTVWGEADCFIQYSFPTQDTESEKNLDSQALESGVSLRPFRTTTTLCVPDPVFNDSQSHTLVLPADVPVQRLLLSACSSQGLAGGGGIQFEVWCRYYYPNVRDQVVARGVLPLSKLCAMVTMQRQEHAGTQTFSLPLIPRTDSAEGHHPHPSGLLDVCVLYKHSVQAAESSRQGAVASRVVSVAVQVHRASGLQAAARGAAERDRSFQYHADVGVNTSVSMQLSFLPESEKRTTRVVARTFCPEFDHHTEFSCNLVIQRSSGETCSLAELLQAAEATFTLYHHGAKQAKHFWSIIKHFFNGQKVSSATSVEWFIPLIYISSRSHLHLGSSLPNIFRNHLNMTNVIYASNYVLVNLFLFPGVYPLFKRSAPDLSGAAVRVHITLSPAHLTPVQEQLSPPVESYLEDVSDAEIREAESFAHAKDSYYQSVEIQQQRKTSGDCKGQDSQVENTFTVSITVERAMHLSLKGSPLIERTGVSPSCCVSYATADAASPVTTAVIENTDSPVWDHQQQTRLSKEILVDPRQTLVFKVWHKGDVERVIGFASVDLSPLLSGFQSVCGWYNITDFSGQCQGQIKVSITPLGTVHGLREERLATSENKAKESDVSFQGFPLSYRTTAMYSSFPTHVTRYPEQIIKSTSENPDFLVSERPSNRHEEHVGNVRRFHQSLQQGDRTLESAQSSEAQSSRSALFTALRKNLGELDDIQRYFSQKLSTPSFPHVSDPNKSSRLSENGVHIREPQSNSHNTEATQLLAKSSRLVCEVNNLFSGHHGRTEDLFPEKPQLVPQVSEDNARLQEQVQLERDLTEATDVAYLDPVTGAADEEGISSPLCFPTEYQNLSTRTRDEQLIQDCVSSESDLAMDNATEQRDNDTSDTCSEDEYEEAVIQPRALNDVTAMTDRTSPWSSILSEPDMASVEELDEVESLGQE